MPLKQLTNRQKILVILAAALFVNGVVYLFSSLFKAFVLFFLTFCLVLWAFKRDKVVSFFTQGVGKILLWLVILGIITAAFGVGFLYFYGTNDNADYTEDAVIIMGAGIKGERLSLTLKYRLDKGLEYIAQNPDAKIIVTGGQGRGESITEAEAMRRYLVQNGIENDRIIMEDKATSTHENLKFSSEFLSEGDRVVVVTDGFHIFRGVSMARKFGLEANHLHSRSYLPQLPMNFVRELAAVCKMYLLGN